jgi:hypothetical protein
MGALIIVLIPPLHHANFPGFDTYTGPIGGVLFRSTTPSNIILARRNTKEHCHRGAVFF